MSDKKWYFNKTVPLILLIIILAAVLILSGCVRNVPEEDAGTMTEEAEDIAEDTSVGTDTGILDLEKGTVMLNSGYTMPIIGLGTWTLSNDEAEESVYAALKCGMRLIDTARRCIYYQQDNAGRL